MKKIYLVEVKEVVSTSEFIEARTPREAEDIMWERYENGNVTLSIRGNHDVKTKKVATLEEVGRRPVHTGSTPTTYHYHRELVDKMEENDHDWIEGFPYEVSLDEVVVTNAVETYCKWVLEHYDEMVSCSYK